MIDLNWANEHNPRGHTLEQIETAREQQRQAARKGERHTVAQIPALRAQAAEMLAVLQPGAASAEIQQALGWLDSATDAPHVAGAVHALRTAIERWAYAAELDRDLNRLLAPALAAQAAQQRAAERRPRPLTIEERLDRIEKALGLS